MSRYRLPSVTPGSGRQSRALGGCEPGTTPHGKMESNDATGSDPRKAIAATGLDSHLIDNSHTFRASDGAPHGPPSSCVPMTGMDASDFGWLSPSMSAGSSPSPIRLIGTTAESRKKCTARAFGLPAIILFFSSAYTLIP